MCKTGWLANIGGRGRRGDTRWFRCDVAVSWSERTDTAAEGFEALAEYQPDVLLCDVAMPGEDGYSLIRRIRKLEPRQGGKTPAIALTAYAGAEDVRRAQDAHFDLHCAKPADMVSLSYAIANLPKHEK